MFSQSRQHNYVYTGIIYDLVRVRVFFFYFSLLSSHSFVLFAISPFHWFSLHLCMFFCVSCRFTCTFFVSLPVSFLSLQYVLNASVLYRFVASISNDNEKKNKIREINANALIASLTERKRLKSKIHQLDENRKHA